MWRSVYDIVRKVPLWAWVLGALGLYLGYLNMRLSTEMTARRVAALRVDSLEAEADSTRRLTLKLLAGTNAAWQRRVVQVEQRNDSLDDALKQQRRALVNATLTVKAYADRLAAPVKLDTAGNRVGEWRSYRAPYTVFARATLPPPPLDGHLQLAIALDTIPVDLRLGCASPGPDGVRPALVTAVTPAWATVTFARVTQTPDLCAPNSILMPKAPKRWPWALAGVAVGIIGWEIIH